MSVVVNGENAEAAAEAAEAEVLRLDEEFSTGKENSDVARINRDGNGNDPGDRRAEGPFFLGVRLVGPVLNPEPEGQRRCI